MSSRDEAKGDEPIRDEARLLALEVDAIHGLVPESGEPPAVRDATVLAVWAWSPRARLLALGPGRRAPVRAQSTPGADAVDEPYAPDRPSRTLDLGLRRLRRRPGGGRRGRPVLDLPRDSRPAPGPLPSWSPPPMAGRPHGT
ncbi:hypothetical protein SMD44_08541 [Streptomyces alboflavus]|uniref:Uncharacterized protein n=1 Tax=Streptomyces alboflavus TaxID=67267 RepID=A0A1Z1WRM7_9ACTN|nr:hypothetical protein [Streptomyces alboflavus]ARX89054.1 hypothetical protein SMD44_08541 [Streptomyces alboflavus]